MTAPDQEGLRRYRRIAVGAWVMQALIVASGAAVRLTQAGLGCEDWPTCNEDELLPEWELHGLIEFGNRVISGLVAVSAIAALVGAYRLKARRPDLIRYAWGLVIGTATQVVLGGITVLADLHPIVVSVHFLVSMVLLWNAQLLWNSARHSEPTIKRPTLTDAVATRLTRVQLGLAGLVLVTGTIVTGTGPNSGDTRADRLDFELTTVARVHSVCVWLLIAATVLLAVRLMTGQSAKDTGNDTAKDTGNETAAAASRAVHLLLLGIAAQGAVGYTQFALGVPAALVEVHVIGSIVVWSLSVQLYLRVHRTTAIGPASAGGSGPIGTDDPAGCEREPLTAG